MGEGRHDDLTGDMMSHRLMPSAASILLLLSSAFTLEWLQDTREEVGRVPAEGADQWTKAGLVRCHRSDVAMRESMRISHPMKSCILRNLMPEEALRTSCRGGELLTAPELG